MKTESASKHGIPSTLHQREVAPRYAYVLPLVGALIGGAVPAAYGVWWLHLFYSQPPLPPGTGRSGTPVLSAIAIILVGTPIGAMTAAAVGFALGFFVDWLRWFRSRA